MAVAVLLGGFHHARSVEIENDHPQITPITQISLRTAGYSQVLKVNRRNLRNLRIGCGSRKKEIMRVRLLLLARLRWCSAAERRSHGGHWANRLMRRPESCGTRHSLVLPTRQPLGVVLVLIESLHQKSPIDQVMPDSVVGVTIWRLRPATRADSGERMIVHEESATRKQWLPERNLA